jgi:hypothetical protein
MTDERLAWEDHTLDVEQLDLFVFTDPEDPEAEARIGAEIIVRQSQLTELPGETFEDIFGDAA